MTSVQHLLPGNVVHKHRHLVSQRHRHERPEVRRKTIIIARLGISKRSQMNNCAMLKRRPPFETQPSTFSFNHTPYDRDYELPPVIPNANNDLDHASVSQFIPSLDSFRSSQQYPYPISGQMAHPDNSHVAATPNNMADNMLRRKTPGGTINGAYESNAHDTQATKHMLVPRNDASQGFTQFNQLDSLLHQAPYRQMQSPQFYGQTVPLVLQPPNQYLGPTASGIGGRGPYGPYWNDGTFVPYRPTALRDGRLYNFQQPDPQFANNPGYGCMSGWQNENPPPLANPASNVRNVNWLTHGGLALPYPYTPQSSAGFISGNIHFLVIVKIIS